MESIVTKTFHVTLPLNDVDNKEMSENHQSYIFGG